jgi:hypothetical protein
MSTEKDFAKAPFPYFGGKSKAADLIWSKFGNDVGNYVEPFLGSAAVWLLRPKDFSGWSILNDLDGNVVNFWRSIAQDPIATARAAAQPVFEADLHARHLALVNGSGKLSRRLMADPNYCEPELAGWWAWGACVWIGSKWCGGNGPWTSGEDDDGFKVLVCGDGGTGVNRQLPHLGDGGTGGLTERKFERICEWFSFLQDAFREARIACGSWERIMSVGTMTRNGICAVLLDPPYSQTQAVYANDSSSISSDVRSWCIDHGQNSNLRIALCGHDGEHNGLERLGWTVESWAKHGGYQGADNRERIWFSPHCIKSKGQGLDLLY